MNIIRGASKLNIVVFIQLLKPAASLLAGWHPTYHPIYPKTGLIKVRKTGFMTNFNNISCKACGASKFCLHKLGLIKVGKLV